MKTLLLCCVASSPLLVGAAAHAADAEAGRRLAQDRCAACHIVTRHGPGDVVAEAPPFEMIGREFAPDWDGLAMSLMGPHAKMNFRLTRRDAANIADYIRTLVE